MPMIENTILILYLKLQLHDRKLIYVLIKTREVKSADMFLKSYWDVIIL